MSFDIFASSTSLSAWFADNVFMVSLICVISVVGGTYFFILGNRFEDTKEVSTKAKIKASLWGTGLTLSMIFAGVSFVMVMTLGTLSDTAEVKQAIQQEYGFELTDESIQSLYNNRGSNGKSFYAVDTSGKLHQYVVTGYKFHFLTKE